MVNCIQAVMRCTCNAQTPKGVEYNPAVKAVYWREGANGNFVKVGYRCPNCGRWYNLSMG